MLSTIVTLAAVVVTAAIASAVLVPEAAVVLGVLAGFATAYYARDGR